MKTSENKYVNSWSGRFRAPLIEFIILYEGAYSPSEAYPYSIAKKCELEWGVDSVPLTTIYSAIKRLENENLIRIDGEIVSGRVQKQISTMPDGFIVLKELQESIKNQCNWFNEFQLDKVI
ncbi:MAG: PadR family transcriptional regulator [Candidatus Heimdallarchaeota archaeon]|nr:PadR family transcriptional regulator [Candidatus Heimdallarchaeota archaeon]